MASPLFYQSINIGVGKVINSDASTLKTVFTAGASGAEVNAIVVSSTDTTNRDLQLVMTISGTDYLIGTVQILANTGNTNAVSSQNILIAANMRNAFDLSTDGNRYLLVPANATLRVRTLTTVTSTREIAVIVQGKNL